MANIRIVLTGGHAATAGIAVVEAVRQIEKLKNAQIYWIGSKTAIEGKNTPTLESQIFPKIDVNFYPIISGKLQTKFTLFTIPAILKIPIGFIHAFIALIKIRPNVILSFGGYSSFPVVFFGKILNIPVIIHEQTVCMGRAFKASVPFASKILLSRVESKAYFKGKNVEVVGNPLMSGIQFIRQKTILPKRPTLLVMGGSRGSNFLNELMLLIVKKLLNDFNIIHLTGDRDFTTQSVFKESLSPAERDGYAIYSKIDPFNMKEIYQNVDLVITRSGANTVAELIHVKKPTIFIPLPRTYLNEQVKNAQYGVDFGLGVILSETEATEERVIMEVKKLQKNWEEMYEKLKGKESPDIDASKKIANIISEYC